MVREKRKYIIDCLDRYWPTQRDFVGKFLKVERNLPEQEILPARGELISMPDWAEDIAVDGCILVPKWAFEQADSKWDKVDWVAVCFWYLNSVAEREHEKQSGPIHSYSFRLKDWDERFWQYAWVNRIALFIRRWIAHESGHNENELFDQVPQAQILLTHDVDAISKTLAIRLKQTIFNAINAIRYLPKGKLVFSAAKAKKAFGFLLSKDDYWCFDKILRLEERQGVKSIFNFYAGKPGNKRNLKERFFDPAYDIHGQRLAEQIKMMCATGWEIGLHQSFDSWEDKQRMREEKENLENIVKTPIESCRQHWLRFSFNRTWKVQQSLGLKRDTTLGFNDRPGFRNSAAVAFCPWDHSADGAMQIESIPLVLMDSHLYDYQYYNDEDRERQLKYWLDEIRFVGGEASVVWHQRVMSKDYDWAKGYEQLLSHIGK
jgi:hypothetical protein